MRDNSLLLVLSKHSCLKNLSANVVAQSGSTRVARDDRRTARGWCVARRAARVLRIFGRSVLVPNSQEVTLAVSGAFERQMPLRKWTYASVCAMFLAIWPPLVPALATESPGRVTFLMPASCFTESKNGLRPMRIRSVSIETPFVDPKNPDLVVPAFTSTGSTISWTASLDPGVHLYRVNAWGDRTPGDVSTGFCVSDDYLIVALPGDSIRLTVDPRNSTDFFDDVFRPLVVYGVAPPGLRLRLLGFVGSPPCGASVTKQPSSPVAIKRDSVGFWSIGGAPRQDVKPVFALGMLQGSHAWYLRVASNFLAYAYIGVPKSVRFDVTPAAVRSALAGPPDKLQCL